MKKIILSLALVSVFMISCKDKVEEQIENTTDMATEQVETVVDSAAVEAEEALESGMNKVDETAKEIKEAVK